MPKTDLNGQPKIGKVERLIGLMLGSGRKGRFGQSFLEHPLEFQVGAYPMRFDQVLDRIRVIQSGAHLITMRPKVLS